MKYLIYSTLFFTLLARGDELLPEGTEVVNGQEAVLTEPTPPAPAMAESDPVPVEVNLATSEANPAPAIVEPNPAPAVAEDSPAPALPPSDTPSIATNTEVSTETNVEEPMAEESPAPIDATAELSAPTPEVVEVPNYGPSAEEGYGSVGLKNDGGILEVGRDADVIPKDPAKLEADRKTSSTPDQAEQPQPPEAAEPSESVTSEPADSAFTENSL